MMYPILMADIINSSSKDSKKVISQFKDVVSQINEKNKKVIISPFTITLGDEFQGITTSMEHGIRTIFDFEELIIQNGYNLKLRYVLLYGSIETEINHENAYGMLGEGLTKSRNILNSFKKKDKRFSVHLSEQDFFKEEYINKAFFIYQNFVDGWKEKDIDIVKTFLQYDDYKEVAKQVNLNPSSVWRRKKSLHLQEYYDIKMILLYLVKSKI